jgi:hypothetical protein
MLAKHWMNPVAKVLESTPVKGFSHAWLLRPGVRYNDQTEEESDAKDRIHQIGSRHGDGYLRPGPVG